MTLKVLDLFSGIGGFSLGLERSGMKTIAFCEINPYCQKILRQHWPNIPVFDDIKSLKADVLPTRPDIICGGYPYQPFSVAGKQKGIKDDRHLWPEMFRIIRECRPTWVIGENVAGHIKLGLDTVLSDLESEGYATRAFVIPACGIGAPHKRDRVWSIGYMEKSGFSGFLLPWSEQSAKKSGRSGKVGNSHYNGSPSDKEYGQTSENARKDKERQNPEFKLEGAGRPGNSETMAYSKDERIQRCGSGGKQKPQLHDEKTLSLRDSKGSWQTHWKTEPSVGRVANGIPDRVDRIKALGNSLVPQIPEIIGKIIMVVTYGR